MGPISEQRLSLVHPVLRARTHQLAGMMSEPLLVVQGLRTSDEQAALFAQGRQQLDAVNALRAKVNWAPITDAQNHKVTNCPPGWSWHQFGLAVDLAPETAAGSIDWNVSHPVWDELISKGESLGLVSGSEWHDDPHFQLTGKFGVNPDDTARQLLAQGGTSSVWAAAEIV